MRTERWLCLVLGAWLGGSLLVGGMVGYQLGGFEDLFARNPLLAERAGFEPHDEPAKKTSLLWVHASELNRVLIAHWNRAQLLLGSLALVLAVAGGARPWVTALLVGVLILVGYLHFWAEPEIVALGRQLDFVPRLPPPPGLARFQAEHRLYFSLEVARLLLLTLATLGGVMASSDCARPRGVLAKP